jgi:copper chaperone CopZ
MHATSFWFFCFSLSLLLSSLPTLGFLYPVVVVGGGWFTMASGVTLKHATAKEQSKTDPTQYYVSHQHNHDSAALQAKSDQQRLSDDISDTSSKNLSKRGLLSSFYIDEYNLLWSPKARKKFTVGSITLFLAHIVGRKIMTLNLPSYDFYASYSPVGIAASVMSNIILPLLASACCSLQLILNIFTVGCAGFNTVLGPVRPYFVSLLLYLTVISRRTAASDWNFWATTTLRWTLTLLPEILDIWNNRNWFKSPQREVSNNNLLVADVKLDIPTMGCVACINSIDQAIRQTNGVESASSSLNPLGMKGGQAEVRLTGNTEEEIYDIVRSLTAAVEKAGFPDSKADTVHIKQRS